MSGKDDHEYGDEGASPPCFMHEADPAYMWASDATAPVEPADLKQWRKAERARLIKQRLAIPTTDDDVAMLGRVVQATSDEQGRTQLAVHTVHMDRDDRERLARFLREHPARRTPAG